MELRILRYFLTVAQAQSISAAAEMLHITQPTLSRQLMELEQEMGAVLLVRGKKNRKVTLTEEGLLLRRRAEEILALTEKTEAEFRQREGIISGEIDIGGGESRAMKWIADTIYEIQQEYPLIRFHLYSGNEEAVTERLEKGLLDFGVLIQPANLSKYQAMTLPEKDVWGVLMRKDNPLTQKSVLQKQDLLNLPLICSSQVIRQDRLQNKFADWFGDDFSHLHLAATYNLIYNAALLVEAGVGYALVLDGLVDVTSVGTALCFRPLAPRLESGLSLVWKQSHIFSKAANLFLERLKKNGFAAPTEKG